MEQEIKIIDVDVRDLIQMAVEAGRKAEKEEKKKDVWFSKTEQLLYSLPSLKLKLSQDEEDLNNDALVMKRKSTDIVRFSSRGSSGLYDPESDYIEGRKISMERTKNEIRRIERALETIKDDKYYIVIELKYFDGLTSEEIAERLECEDRTVRRNKNRLINKLKIILFGAIALNI